MKNKIKFLTNTEDKKRLMSNFFSLSVLQGANYILPLLTLPYLVRVLGVEYFGLLAFATAMITYFQILTDYGFDLTATREISIHRENKEKVVEIFSSVMTIKIILMFVSFFLLSILVFSFEKFSKDALVYFLTFGIVIGQVLFPVWFFQGMERMKYITYLNILSKVIFTIAIFVFVQEQSDYYLVPFLTSIGFMIAGIWSLYLIKKEFGISFQLQTHLTIKKYFIDGWDVFVSRIFVSLYTTINILLLGFFTNHTVVGYYAIAEKIVNAVGGLFTPANQTIYPYMAKIYNKQKEKFFDFTKKVAISYLVLAIVMCIALYIFSEFIVRIISGNVDVNIMNIYYVLIFTLITIPFGPLFTQVLIIQKRNKEFNKIVRNTFILNMLIAPFLIFNYSGIGLAVSINIVYLYHVLYLFKTLKFQGEN
ncbi:MAG: flippase [Aliarcobacter sp.]|nr:flippase [Aliarcobacter sp.]